MVIVWTINAKQGENSTFETANGTLTAIGGGYGGTGPWNHTLQGSSWFWRIWWWSFRL
jgi:hypothetical protein